MEIFGLATGVLHKFDLPLDDKLKILSKYGANAVELVLILPEVATDFEITKSLRNELDKFEYVSIHAPFIMPASNKSTNPYVRMIYGDDDNTKRIYKKLENISDLLNIDAVVFHPDTVKVKTLLSEYNFKVAMENMDKNKQEGIDPDYFSKMNDEYNFNYVLDLHHIFTHDQKMESTYEYIEVMGNKLQHLHVSGQTGDKGHMPINISENRELIMSFVKKLQKPIILEGTISASNIEEGVKKELDYVKSVLSEDN